MTAPAPPALDCPTPAPADPHAAEPSAARTAVGEPTGAARKGVVTALPRAKRFPADGAHPSADPVPERPGIRIYAPPVYRHHYDGARWSTRHGGIPTAAYACPCGQTGTARGPDAVAALVTEYAAHRSGCAGTPIPLERRNAA